MKKPPFLYAIRRIHIRTLYAGLSLFGPAFSDRKYATPKLARCVFWQKILGINRKVPWPVHWTSRVQAAHKIERGTRCPGLSVHCYIDGRNGIKLGRNVWVGPRVSLISMNHDTSDYARYRDSEPIVFGNDCWLGAGCIILPGVRLGNHVVVAAGAVVSKSFEQDDILLAGVPARIIKRLGPYEGHKERSESS